MRQKHVLSFLLLLVSCFSGGCGLHSWGSKRVSTEPGSAHTTTLMPGKSIYLAAIMPYPEDMSDSPEFVVAQFAKNLSLVSQSIQVGPPVHGDAEGIAASRAAEADYLVLLQIKKWKKHSLLSPGHKAALTVALIDVATEQVRNRSTIEASCYMMVVGLEQSPRECIRPQVASWMESAFGVTVPSKPQTDPQTFKAFSY